ncbi:MAG: hypothetical protein ACLFQX_08215 [Candidatus Kapaibacterium sp.]
MKRLLLLAIILMLTSCSTMEQLLYDTASRVNITIDGTEAEGDAIDSIRISFPATYWVEDESRTIENKDYYLFQDGYNIWYMRVDSIRRTEVERKDTLIYIYEK